MKRLLTASHGPRGDKENRKLQKKFEGKVIK